MTLSTSCTVPGLDTQGYAETLSGGEEEWQEITSQRLYTNCFIWTEDKRMLLGYKKRGFGKGKFNGFGGKVEEGETVSAAASRELMEEAGIKADLVRCGIMLYNSTSFPAQYVEVFRANAFQGTPTESDEMRPEWFDLPDSASEPSQNKPFPFEKMWEDAKLWIPLMLSGDHFVGRMDFGPCSSKTNADDGAMTRWWIGTRRDHVI